MHIGSSKNDKGKPQVNKWASNVELNPLLFLYQIRYLRKSQHFEKFALSSTVYFEPLLDPEIDSLLGN